MPELLGLGPGPAVATLLVFFGAGVVKGGLGFGLPLVSVSVLPLFTPIEVALGINAVVLPLTNVWQYGRSGLAWTTLHRFWPVLLGLAVGVPVGGALIASIKPSTLTLSLGILIAGFAVMTGLNPRLAIPWHLERAIGVAIGVVAGVIGVLTTVNGPVFVSYLVGLGTERRLMVAALGLFFLFSGILIAGSFWLVGLLDGGRLALAALCLVPVFAGMRLGNLLADRLSVERFRRLVLCVLFLLGMNLFVRGLLDSSDEALAEANRSASGQVEALLPDEGPEVGALWPSILPRLVF